MIDQRAWGLGWNWFNRLDWGLKGFGFNGPGLDSPTQGFSGLGSNRLEPGLVLPKGLVSKNWAARLGLGSLGLRPVLTWPEGLVLGRVQKGFRFLMGLGLKA